jgi:hypothetical protein
MGQAFLPISRSFPKGRTRRGQKFFRICGQSRSARHSPPGRISTLALSLSLISATPRGARIRAGPLQPAIQQDEMNRVAVRCAFCRVDQRRWAAADAPTAQVQRISARPSSIMSLRASPDRNDPGRVGDPSLKHGQALRVWLAFPPLVRLIFCLLQEFHAITALDRCLFCRPDLCRAVPLSLLLGLF